MKINFKIVKNKLIEICSIYSLTIIAYTVNKFVSFMSCHVIFSNLDVDYHIINHIIIYF